MIIPMLCVTIFVILVVWFLLPRVARLMIHTPTAISIFVCLSMVQRSEERRVGKECRSGGSPYHYNKNERRRKAQSAAQRPSPHRRRHCAAAPAERPRHARRRPPRRRRTA